jgi:hypothetical protein
MTTHGEVLPGARVDRLANADLRAGPRYVDQLLSTTSVRDLLKGGAATPDRDQDIAAEIAIRGGTSRLIKPSDLLLDPFLREAQISIGGAARAKGRAAAAVLERFPTGGRLGRSCR